MTRIASEHITCKSMGTTGTATGDPPPRRDPPMPSTIIKSGEDEGGLQRVKVSLGSVSSRPKETSGDSAGGPPAPGTVTGNEPEEPEKPEILPFLLILLLVMVVFVVLKVMEFG